MSPDLTTQAVNAALGSNWNEAIKINLEILKEKKDDVEALNRLARAYKESGDYKLAQKTYHKVIILDRYNPIAQKNLKLLDKLPKSYKKQGNNGDASPITNHCQPNMFLEEPGRTRVVSLINLAPASNLLPLCCGDGISLTIKRRTVAITFGTTYLGALPDDLSIKLIKRISGGNRYEGFVKTVGHNSLSVFIREVYRAPRFKNQPTFPGAGGEYYLGKDENSEFGEEGENASDDDSLAEEDLPLN